MEELLFFFYLLINLAGARSLLYITPYNRQFGKTEIECTPRFNAKSLYKSHHFSDQNSNEPNPHTKPDPTIIQIMTYALRQPKREKPRDRPQKRQRWIPLKLQKHKSACL